ncbi:MAG: ABC transporter permease [Planctomycetes bacterium]|nr:ABC transporter permease [Planctomycetota bacterium]
MDRRKLRVLLRHRTAMLGLALLVVIAALAVAVRWVSPHDPDEMSAASRELGPSASYWFGTDNSGRDIFTRLWVGARVSLLIGVASVVFSIAIGVPLGAVAGYAGGRTDMLLSRLVDLLLSFPGILLAICIAAAMGTGLRTVVIAVGVVGIPQFARQARASVLQLRELEFVAASRALGAGHARILFLDILPNALGPLIVLATLGVGGAILTAAGLSFLGLGVETGTPEWGAMLHDGYGYWRRSAGLALFSGLAISTTVLAFNLFGDGLRDALDPRSTRG